MNVATMPLKAFLAAAILFLLAITAGCSSSGGEDEGDDPVINPWVLDGNRDLDNDGFANLDDNCPTEKNPDQFDTDADGIGDACEGEVAAVEEADPAIDLTPGNTPEILINGYNASVAMHAGGAFVQLNRFTWIETGSGASFTFSEQRRDEWSVYLRDDSRGVDIQLDFHRREIIYSDASSRFVLYAMTSYDPADTNGYAATRVEYTAPGKTFGVGGFVQIDADSWSESNADDTFVFDEVGRDEWSVYLHDPGRDVSIQLDLFREMVVYSDAVTSFDLYQINTAVPEKINAFVMREMVTDFASFLQVSPYRWVETLADGREFTYDEYLRDEWSSYLHDTDRDVYIQLDLHLDIVNFHVGGDPWEPYFGVVSVVETPEVIQTSGPIAWYNFDGGTAADASGNERHLAWEGPVLQDPLGVVAEGLHLGGNGAAAILPEGIVDYLEDFTLSAYVKLDRLERNTRIIDIGNDSGGYLYLAPMGGADDRLRFVINDGSGEQVIEAATPLTGGINGYNARVVMHASGAFVKLNTNDWVENGATETNAFSEVARDEWSVYLHDASRGVSIQLDLHRKKIVYSDATQTFDLYDITTARPDQINGYAASRIGHAGGGFYHLGPDRWIEDAGEHSFVFEEVARDEWSVYLYDPNRRVEIQLDLFRKEIIYRDSTQEFVLYQILSTRPGGSAANWVHVAVTREGQTGRLYVNGELVGSNLAMTIGPADLGHTTFNKIGRSRNPADPDLIGSVDEIRIYNRVIDVRELREIIAPDPELITLMGTDVQFTPEELKTELAASGLILVTNDEIGPNECALVYANADREDISAEVGLLTCSVRSANGDIELTTSLVYGGCDVARLDQGVGSRCEVGLGKNELKLRVSDNPPVYNEITLKGPNATECTAISSENTCFGLGAELASYETGFKNESGSGASAGVCVGVGARASGGYADGVFSASVNLKLGIGFKVGISVSEEDARKAYELGESAYLAVGSEVVAVGDKTVEVFDDFGNEVHDAGGKLVGEIEVAAEPVIVLVEDAGQSVQQTYESAENAVESAAQDAAEGLVDTAGVVATGVDTATRDTVKFVGSTVNSISSCVENFWGCF